MSYVQGLRGVSRWFTPLACGPGSPELSCFPLLSGFLGLLLGLTQTENTGGATSNTCCLNARVSWAGRHAGG